MIHPERKQGLEVYLPIFLCGYLFKKPKQTIFR